MRLDIAVDDAGNAYVTGDTRATDFPTTAGAPQLIPLAGGSDAFVTKLNATGAGLVYSTDLGGSVDGIGFEIGTAIAVDGVGSVVRGGLHFIRPISRRPQGPPKHRPMPVILTLFSQSWTRPDPG